MTLDQERELAELRALVAALRKDNARLRHAANIARERLRTIQHRMLAQLTEPPAAEGCVKIRLHTAQEAFAFAEHVAISTDTDVDTLDIYKCQVCPRHPTTGDRIFHIYTLDHDKTTPERKAQVAQRRARAREEGRLLGQRISPADLARIKKSHDYDDKT